MEHKITRTDQASCRSRSGLCYMWDCSCGATTGGNCYPSPEQNEKAIRRHLARSET